MNESKTTIIFVAVAAVFALAAVGSQYLNRPTNSADFELVGKPFFEDFTSASQAQSLEVSAVDPESARLKRFSVVNQDGLWRIPSHYDYPAEAAARLATTASSIMGIERESLAGRLAKEHERLGVLNPLADDIEDPEGVGKRITLKDSSGEVVVDYIVGKEAGEVVLSETDQPFGARGNEKYYYVRRPDEQQTYKVKLDIDLSTRFSDWIDPDLLRVDRNDITRIQIDNYSLEEDRSNPLVQNKALFKSQGDKLDISRKSSTDPWELVGLDAASEELQNSRINEMLGVFDQMEIAGVRPKYKYKDHLLLTPDLKLNRIPEMEKNPQEFSRAISRLQNELDQKGFNLAGNAQKMELVSQNGDLEIGTQTGVVYTLHVGQAFDGDEAEIEIGSQGDTDSDSDSGDSQENDDGKSTTVTDQDPANGGDEGDEEKPEEAKNRYLMVRVSFDESLIKPKPVAPEPPVEPVKPEGYSPPVEEPEKTEESGDPDPDGVVKPPTDEEPARSPEFEAYDKAIKAFENQKLEFEMAQTKFKSDTEEFAKKVEDGKKLVDELNERFGDWYYVITGDNLNTLQTERVDLVAEKEKPADDPALPPRPNISFPDLPNANDGPGDKPKAAQPEPTEESNSEVPDDSGENPGEQESESIADEKKDPAKESTTLNPDDDSQADPKVKSTESSDPDTKPNSDDKTGAGSTPDQEKDSQGDSRPSTEAKSL